MFRWSYLFSTVLGGAGVGLSGLVLLCSDPEPRLILDGAVYSIDIESPRRTESSVADAVHLRAAQLLDHDVHLSDGLHSYPVSARKLGYFVDERAAVSRLTNRLTKAREGRNTQQRWMARLLNRPLRIAAELPLELDEERARPALLDIALLVDRPPVDAQMLIAEHEIIPSESGRRLSIDATLVRLTHDAEPAHRLAELSIEEIEPSVTEQDLAPVDVTRVLSSFETSFRGKAGPRAVNIRTAGRYLNGAVLLPGEVLSFNEYVGRRIHGRGFVDAPVIVNDELEQDVGGGVCQVATTLHGAAVFGNLEVVYRRSHSRPSGYAPLGLDATVIDGQVDLKLRNPYDEPLLVHVSFPSEYTIRVELLGADPIVKVKHDYSVTHREAYARRVWHRSNVKEGTFEQKQKGIEGMDVVSILRIQHPDGKIESRHYTSKYYPVPEVFWVAEGTDLGSLPDVADHITHVVVDGDDPESGQSGGTATETGEEPPSIDAPRQVL